MTPQLQQINCIVCICCDIIPILTHYKTDSRIVISWQKPAVDLMLSHIICLAFSLSQDDIHLESANFTAAGWKFEMRPPSRPS